MKKLLLLAFVYTSLLVSAQEIFNDIQVQSVLRLPDKEAIKSHIQYLADDKLQGRRASSPGYKMAVDYVINQFKQLGVAPKGDEGYIQKVIIRTGKLDSTKTTFTWNNQALQFGVDYAVLPNMNSLVIDFEGEVVFVGQGIAAPHLNHDDYAGLDVKGKVVMMVASVPETFPASERAHFTSTAMRADFAASKGAIGAIAINTTARQFNVARAGAKNGIQGIVNKNKWVTARNGATHPNMKFYAIGRDTFFNPVIENLEKGDRVGTVKVKTATSFTEFETYNVIGIVPGSDKNLKDEYVVHTAHLDHLGIRSKIDGDSIYNGAHDNASGVACLLELAKLYKKSKLRRSLLIAMVTGEEMGLLGSSYLASNPPVDKKNIVANLNSDMPTFIAPLLSIEPLGAWNSSLLNEVTNAARYLNIEIQQDHVPDQVRFTRSDQYSFIREGIPALNIKYGLKASDPSIDLKKMIDDWTKEYYHKPADEYREDLFDWDAAITYVKLYYLIGYQIANAAERPTWNKGDFFGETFGSN